MKQSMTVVEYLIDALKAIKVKHVFGVPGDFSFPINDAICNDDNIEWIGCSNELNAAYAADGYARINGVAALNTTFGPGELSALCGVAGAYSANLPVIFIVGMPSITLMQTNKLIHHTLGDGHFNEFIKMASEITETSTVLTADNPEFEINRLIQTALTHKRPVYIGVPEDVANIKLPQVKPFDFSFEPPNATNDVAALAKLIAERINLAEKPALIVGEHLRVYNAKESALRLINTTNLPFATMFSDKAIIDETNPCFIGLYDGKVINRSVRQYIENSDCLVNLGAQLTDFNTGGFSAKWPKNTITIMGNDIEFDGQNHKAVNMTALIEQITEYIIPREDISYSCFMGLQASNHGGDDLITAASLYPRLEHFFKEGDQIITETGTISMGLGMAHLPKNARFENQTLWGSIGWATPAAFGACLAKPESRTILLTGEGSHQLTAQEIGQFYRYNQKPIIIVLNNKGYLIERILCKEPIIAYNDVCQWNYTQLPSALGVKDWFVASVSTNGELDYVLEMATNTKTGVYIEVVTSDMETPPLAANLAAQLNTARGLPVHVAPVEE